MIDETAETVVACLIEALAMQLDRSGVPALELGAVAALTGLSRAEANLIFSCAGHLVHYGDTEAEPVGILIQLISNIQRGEIPPDAVLVPGDEVRLDGELPADLAAKYDPAWLRETVFVVRYVSDDSTVDVQPDLREDYVIETVPAAIVTPAWAQKTP
jgi:hypothetical protein